MKYAFLVKNFRKLSFEERVVAICHGLTLLFCFFPWIAIEPLYDDAYWNGAFSGPSGLIGTCIFLIALGVGLFFADKLFETKKIKLPFPSKYLFLGAGVQQVILIVLAWSVLMSVSRDFENSEFRFGIFACFLVQVVGLVAAYLQSQNERTKKARDFFQHPPSEKEKEGTKSEPMGGLFAENKTSHK